MHPILVSTALLALTVAAATPSSAAEPLTTTQLPRTVRPTHYDVSIVPNAKALTFTGKVEIAIEVLHPTPSITLQALDITVASAKLSSSDVKTKATFAPPKVRVDEAEQTATFTFAKAVPAGRYKLQIDYAGKIGTQAAGLFAIDYGPAEASKRALYTQFENSDARRMIPSWDEPAYKATFTLHATVPKEEMAVSNMPIASSVDLAGGLKLVHFAPSPKMSTYLLFFALGDFERVAATVDGAEVGVVTRRGVTDQAAFALESSKAVLREYNDYFGAPYPLPKLDNIAAPGSSQFFGAMENWGAIMTFEYAILLDPSISTAADRQGVFATAAHEIAHQWFGNLVTMSWWDDLWLNEGFASWMGSRITERLHPEWNTSLDAVDGREGAMQRDSISTTHPVVQHIETVDQASQAFDAITYQKGEAVIRMLEGYVGADAWRAGVRRYIKALSYGSSVSNDLWREVEAAAARPVMAIARDFTLQPGVPLVTVGDVACEAGRSQVTLTQGEFSKDQPGKKALVWQTPVMVKPLGEAKATQALVAGGKASLSLPGCSPIIVNAGQNGYFRTLYKPGPFSQLAASFARLDPVDQLGITYDSWALGLAGLQPVSDVLDLAAKASVDADPQVWSQIGRIFLGLDRYYQGQPAQQARFRKFAISRLAPVFARLGWNSRPDELDPVTILRTDLIGILSELGDQGVIDEARRRYAARTSNPDGLPASLRRTILRVVAQHADVATWEELQAAARAETAAQVKDDLYALLASAEDVNLAERALKLALTSEPGATNTAAMIGAVSLRHPDKAFDFAIANMSAVDQSVTASSRSQYYAGLAFRSADPAMIDKVDAYAKKYLAEGSRRDAETTKAGIKDRIRVRRESLPLVDAWLEGKSQ